jgi:hypothetical protein
MWALPGNQFCYLASLSKRVEQNRNVECGHPQEINFVTRHLSQSVQNTIESLNAGTPREPTLLPLVHLKSEKHYRNIECGHSQRINFVARHSLKACKTQ